MKKIFFVFSIMALFILVSSSVFASAPVASPKCYVEGLIQSVEFKDAYDEPCLTEKYGCPTDIELNHPARYFFKIKIDSISYISGYKDYVTCEDMLPLNTEKTIFINKDEVKTDDSFEPGQIIKGPVSSFRGISFDSYELEKTITDNQDIETEDSGSKAITDNQDIETEDSGSKTSIYIIVTIAIIIILLLIIYFLRKNKKYVYNK